MQFSGDVPHDPQAIADYLAHGEPLRMNVSKEADRVFRFELRKSEVKRWANLEAAMFQDFYGKRSNAA